MFKNLLRFIVFFTQFALQKNVINKNSILNFMLCQLRTHIERNRSRLYHAREKKTIHMLLLNCVSIYVKLYFMNVHVLFIFCRESKHVRHFD